MTNLEPGSDHNLLGNRNQGNPHPMYLRKTGPYDFTGDVTFTRPQEFKKGIDVNTVGDDWAWTFLGHNNWSWQGNDDTDHAVAMTAGGTGFEVTGWFQYNGTSGPYGLHIGGALVLIPTTIDDGDSPYAYGPTSKSVVMVDARVAPVTVTLPAAPRTGLVVIVKDQYGVAGTNNITINASHAIDTNVGNTYVVSDNYEAPWLEFDGTEWWLI